MTTAAPSRYATGDQILDLASDFFAFASWLMEEKELAPIRPTDHIITCHLDDKETLEAKASSLGLQVVRKGSQWRAEKTFGKTITYVLWTEDVES